MRDPGEAGGGRGELPELSAAGLKASAARGSPGRATLVIPDPFYFSAGLPVLLWAKALNNTLKLPGEGSPKHRRGHFPYLHPLALAGQGNCKVI